MRIGWVNPIEYMQHIFAYYLGYPWYRLHIWCLSYTSLLNDWLIFSEFYASADIMLLDGVTLFIAGCIMKFLCILFSVCDDVTFTHSQGLIDARCRQDAWWWYNFMYHSIECEFTFMPHCIEELSGRWSKIFMDMYRRINHICQNVSNCECTCL